MEKALFPEARKLPRVSPQHFADVLTTPTEEERMSADEYTPTDADDREVVTDDEEDYPRG